MCCHSVFRFLTGRHAADTAPDRVVIEGLAIEDSLTGVAGYPDEGGNTLLNRKLGNYLACDANKDIAERRFHEEIGPAFDGDAVRWQQDMLHTIVVNTKAVFANLTVIPGFCFRHVVMTCERIDRKNHTVCRVVRSYCCLSDHA